MSSGATRTARGTRAAPPPDLRARLQGIAPFDGKLHVPPVRPGIVARAGLVDRVRAGAPVMVISAPAGYGKTTLLSQWAAVEERPFAWLTLTPGDNDLTVLVAYLVRALDAVDPLPTATLAGFAAAGADGPTVLLPRLGRALLERSEPFVLALDDVHVLTDPDCRSALGVLAAHLPDGSQLVLASRQDPPLARARLRAGRTLAEIRGGGPGPHDRRERHRAARSRRGVRRRDGRGPGGADGGLGRRDLPGRTGRAGSRRRGGRGAALQRRQQARRRLPARRARRRAP